ncbi:MAG: DUF2206 domain-containing protein [Methanocella sp.]
MLVKNIFRINDWKIAEFLPVIFSLQLGLLGLCLLDALGYQVPLIRPIVGFVYLTFVPGALLLRILKVHKKSSVETVLYAAGLSLIFDMSAGFFINMVYPFVGIDSPITGYNIITAMLLGTVLLSILCILRDREYYDPDIMLEIDRKSMVPALLLLLLPLVSIAGSYAVNAYDNNLLIYVVILAIAAIVLLCGFDKLIPQRLYPLVIFVVALSLEFHNAFISNYLWSWDVHVEYYTASQVIGAGYWDSSIPLTVNAMLSIVFLAPFYHLVGGIELTWVFKIVYQLIFCLVPLGLYVLYEKQTNGKIACMACMFFMFLVTFFTEMQGLARQETAELFLVLIMLLLIDADLDRRIMSFLVILFGIGLIVSHYGLSYIYLIVFAMSMILLVLLRSSKKLLNKVRKGNLHEEFMRLPANNAFTFAFLGIFACFLFFWYIYTGGSATLNSISYLLYKMGTNIFTEFLNPEHVQGLNYLLQGYSSPLYEIKKYMQLIFQALIVIGFAFVVFESFIALRRKYRFSLEYVVLLFVNLLICVFSITLPYFSSSLNTSRVFQITLIILSPMCIIGGLELIKAVTSPLKLLKAGISLEQPVKIMAVILVIYLFFNTGLVFNVLNDRPISVALGAGQVNSYSLYDRAVLYDPLNTFEQDYDAATWLDRYRLEDTVVYSDYISLHPLMSYGNVPMAETARLQLNSTGPQKGSYVYLGYANLNGDVFKEKSGARAFYETGKVLPGLERYNEIYASNGSAIYDVP